MSKNELSPIYKWTGGKRKEIKIFSEYYPEFVKSSKDFKFVEPFFGGVTIRELSIITLFLFLLYFQI